MVTHALGIMRHITVWAPRNEHLLPGSLLLDPLLRLLFKIHEPLHLHALVVLDVLRKLKLGVI